MPEQAKAQKRILLIYPKVGIAGSLVRHMPLSLLYAAVDSIKMGFAIDVFDVRLEPKQWRDGIAAKISPNTVLIGLSVMTGAPIKNATDISRWVKKNYPHLSVVWGGPHAAFNNKEILINQDVDFAISGYGSRPLSQLAMHLSKESNAVSLQYIAGLSYKNGIDIVSVPPENSFEFVDYRDIPYHLIELNLTRYGQLDTTDRIFSMYSVLGCPYLCTFCSSPAQYRNMKKKFIPLPPQEVVDHIEYVHRKYSATYVYFIDDDSFVDLFHVEAIIDEIRRRGIKVRLGFRGARINELKKMSDEYLSKLSAAGTNIMHVGAESGSQRMLDLFHKDCTVDDIINVNRKLARHNGIKIAYNWIVGIPGETIEDLRQTQKLMLMLAKDNPNAIIFFPNTFRPLPGTELYNFALKYGYQKPRRLEEWLNEEVEGNYQSPWSSPKIRAMINMMQVTSYFIDDKVFKIEMGKSFKLMIIRFLAYFYKPIAKIRLSYGLSYFLIENKIFRWVAARYRD